MIFYYRSVGTALLITSLAASSAYSLECPQPQLKSSPGVIIETPADIVSSSQILANGGSNAISTMIFRLRQRNPRSSDGAILNYLLTPIVML